MPAQMSYGDIPADRVWKELYSGSFVGNLVIIIGQMLKDWKNFDRNFPKLKEYRGYLKK